MPVSPVPGVLSLKPAFHSVRPGFPLCILWILHRSLDSDSSWFAGSTASGTLGETHPISSQILWSLSLAPGPPGWWGKGLDNTVFKPKTGWGGAACYLQLGKTFEWEISIKNPHPNSLAVQWLGLLAFTARAWVQSLVRELRSCKPRDMAKRKKPQKTLIQIPWRCYPWLYFLSFFSLFKCFYNIGKWVPGN